MMPAETHKPGLENRPADACWNRIGVQGDRSCPRLAEAGQCGNCPAFSEAGQTLFDREATPEYLEEWTRQLAAADSATVVDSVSLLLFRIGREWLAIEARWVVEVIPPRPIHRIPHRTNGVLLGFANIRGELQLCVSLEKVLGIEVPPAAETPAADSSAQPRPRMIVAEHQQHRWAFPVDEVEGVHRIPAGEMENLPYTVQRSAHYCCQALYCHEGGRKVGVLSAARLFQALERTVR
jgi:chemotaxis-related protein WspD